MRGMLRFVLILPDGSKSLIPAEWTDAGSGDRKPVSTGDLIGSLQHLLQLRPRSSRPTPARKAFIYVRQSSVSQVEHNRESPRGSTPWATERNNSVGRKISRHR